MLKKRVPPQDNLIVSVLVPARNEEENISACLKGLSAQNYSAFEIIVLNDHSADRTAELVKTYCHVDSRIRLIEGQELPAGWTGKNWACYQLSRKANGEILIFTDADNRHAPYAIANTVGWMQKLRLGLFSAFPQQITVTLAEKLVIPVIDMFVYAALPLWLTYYARSPSLAAANGQWIAFTREAYNRIGGHQEVRHKIVEDVELSRLAKRKGIKILTSPGTGAVFGHMYHSWKETWEGFSKNLFGLMGYKTIPFFTVLLVLLVICVLPYFLIWLSPFSTLAAIALALNLLLRLIMVCKYRHPIFTSVVLHPLAIVFTTIIGLNSFLCFKRGRVQWKGREIDFRQ
ncbi:glycosyltransferase [Candidatus Poribacteria bacterium]|nr:glycosyltransferase [Candidatus Poribacteria bacterium]